MYIQITVFKWFLIKLTQCSNKSKTDFTFKVICYTTSSSITNSSRIIWNRSKLIIYFKKPNLANFEGENMEVFLSGRKKHSCLWWKPSEWCFFQGYMDHGRRPQGMLKSVWWCNCHIDTGTGLLILAWLIILLIGQPVGPQCKVRSVFTLTTHTDDVWLKCITLYQHTKWL